MPVDELNTVLTELSCPETKRLSGKYHLRDEYFHEYDATFLHLSHTQHEIARQGYLRIT